MIQGFPLLLRCAVALPLLAAALSARADQPAPPRCQYLHVATLPLSYAGSNLDITMAGTINGTPATLAVDTGSLMISLTPTGAERRGLLLHDIGWRRRGVSGEANLYSVRVDDFSAGPARAGGGYMRVVADLPSTPGVDGIAGASFLLQTDLEFSLATKELRFFRPNNCQDTFLGYWDPAAVAIPFVTDWRWDRSPEFIVQLNGRKLRAIIDSSANTSVVTLDAARRAGLKLDAPGVEHAGHIVSSGKEWVAKWSASFETLQIGDEIIRDAQLGVMDVDDIRADLLLGADFLRAHRVLFAMNQRKLYISYVGGEPLGQRRMLEPWMLREAESGNSDAQLALADMYRYGRGVPKDAQQSSAWLQKALASGNPQASFMVARGLGERGEYAQAARHLRAGLDRLPGERYAALSLYIARLRSGEAELGRRELEASLAGVDQQAWPLPIAQYYLGRLSEEQLLAAAGGERKLAEARTCVARSHIAERHAALGETGKADAVLAQRRDCKDRN